MIAFPADSRRKEAAASTLRPAGAGKKGKEAAASMARPAGAGKKKVEAPASESRVPLACLFTAEGRPVGTFTPEGRPVGAGKKRNASTAGKKMEETTALKKMEETTALMKIEETTALKKMEETTALMKIEEGAKPVDSLWKEGEMLRLRQEFWEAEDRYSEIRHKVHHGTPLERKRPAVDDTKKKKLVRLICADAYIDSIIKDPLMMPEFSAKQIKKFPRCDRESYKALKVINAKKRAYHHALIEQRRAFGFAYDELEVPDDDEKEVTDHQEDEAVVVVKN